ncbi:MAG: host attachment protein [Myxococcota bacterium]
MARSIVVVANGSRARFYTLGADVLTLKAELDHPGSRARESELGTDRPGRQFLQGPGPQRSAYERQVSPHRHELQAFARELRDELERQRRETGIASAAVFAPPQLLGELRSVMDGEGIAWVNRDYTAATDVTILEACRDQGLPGARVRTGV